MKIIMTGATGFVGSTLVRKLHSQNHTITVLTRSADRAKSTFSDLKDRVEFVEWDAPYNDIPVGTFKDANGLINLMGENIGGKRWSESQKKKLRDSRVLACLLYTSPSPRD